MVSLLVCCSLVKPKDPKCGDAPLNFKYIVMPVREYLKKYYHSNSLFLRPLAFLYRTWIHRVLPEKVFVKSRFKRLFGYSLDLKNPKTFNEKIQWLKLYDRTPLHTLCADKIAARSYISDKVGEEHLVPLLMTTPKVTDLTYEHLPQNPFIIKTNHDSGSYKIIKNKNEVTDWEAIQTFFARRLQKNYYYEAKEWQYKNIPPQLLVETLLQNHKGKIPADYKMHCFGGKPEYIQVVSGRENDQQFINFYDTNWNKMPFTWIPASNKDKTYPPCVAEVAKPTCIEKMLRFAAILSEPFVYLRVDFYVIEDHFYIGELTFHPNGGFERIVPEEWDRKLGDMIQLPV